MSIYTNYDGHFVSTVLTWLTSVLGKPQESSSPFSWFGRDGIVTLTETAEFLQVDARRLTLLERLWDKLRSVGRR
jgi:hypothetical protein